MEKVSILPNDISLCVRVYCMLYMMVWLPTEIITTIIQYSTRIFASVYYIRPIYIFNYLNINI
jgi:hypothetical protein